MSSCPAEVRALNLCCSTLVLLGTYRPPEKHGMSKTPILFKKVFATDVLSPTEINMSVLQGRLF